MTEILNTDSFLIISALQGKISDQAIPYIFDCSIQDFRVYNCMYMTAVYINVVYLAAVPALNETELQEPQYSRQH